MKRHFTDYLPYVLGVLILLSVTAIAAEEHLTLFTRGTDHPPDIEFTWTPVGRVDLREMQAKLKITDDYGIDFSTYRFTIVELKKTMDLPIPGLVGREYEQDVSFSMLADNAILQVARQATIQISVADDAGQETSIEKVIKLK